MSERGKPAGFDPKSGAVHGSGSGAGGGNRGEDHDDDPAAGSGRRPAGRTEGHPLPGSDEARLDEIPEEMARRKGLGAAAEPGGPAKVAVNPDGEPYPAGGEPD